MHFPNKTPYTYKMLHFLSHLIKKNQLYKKQPLQTVFFSVNKSRNTRSRQLK